jgi:acyl-CoA thioesterase-1
MRAVLVPIILTFVMLAGCTKNEEKSEPVLTSAVPRATADRDSRPVIVVYGDSLSEVGADSGRSFPDVLQRMLDERGYRYRIVNQGISGDTTTGGVGRTQAAIELKPDLLILELGGNDGLRGVPVAESKQNLEKMIQAFQGAGIRVLMAGMSLPPNYGAEYIHSFESMYRDLAAKYQLPLIPFLLSDIAKGLRTHPEWLSQDGIHPTPAGNKVVAGTVLKTLEPLLKK